MKVSYITCDGHLSAAYVDDMVTGSGVDKYTDVPVTVAWDGNNWREVTE